jgi:hypothetical protein
MPYIERTFSCPECIARLTLRVSQEDGIKLGCYSCGYEDNLSDDLYFPDGWKVITKTAFEHYLVVQMSGCTNMLINTNVRKLSGWRLTENTIHLIQKHYEQLAHMWPDVMGSKDLEEEARELWKEEGQIG